MITAIAVFPPLESPPFDDLLLPSVSPARPALLVDEDFVEPVDEESAAVDVIVTKTVLPGWPLLEATILADVDVITDAEVVVELLAVVDVLCMVGMVEEDDVEAVVGMLLVV